jgi:hypothetical protein
MTWQELLDHLNASGEEGREYLRRYTPQFVQGGLLSLAKLLGLYIAFTDEKSQSPTDIAGRRIAIYMDLLWRRLRSWETADLDLLVWTMRNLLELHFWTGFIAEAPENARAFIQEADIDQRELFEVFLKQQGDLRDIGPCAIQVLVNDAPAGKPRKVQVADPILWKECCKYVHVTAWLLNDYDRHMKDEDMRHKIIAFALHYAAAITRILIISNPDTESLLQQSNSVN